VLALAHAKAISYPLPHDELVGL